MTGPDDFDSRISSLYGLYTPPEGMDEDHETAMRSLVRKDREQTIQFRKTYGDDVLKISKRWIYFVMLVVVADMATSAFVGRSATDAAPLSVLVASPFAMLFIVLKSIFPKTTVSRHESHTEGED